MQHSLGSNSVQYPVIRPTIPRLISCPSGGNVRQSLEQFDVRFGCVTRASHTDDSGKILGTFGSIPCMISVCSGACPRGTDIVVSSGTDTKSSFNEADRCSAFQQIEQTKRRFQNNGQEDRSKKQEAMGDANHYDEKSIQDTHKRLSTEHIDFSHVFIALAPSGAMSPFTASSRIQGIPPMSSQQRSFPGRGTP